MAADSSLREEAARVMKEENEKSTVRQTAIRLRPQPMLPFISDIPWGAV
jgi:hypothetical protein